MNLRARLAIRIAKLTSKLIKKLNRGSGVTLPGLVARIICPNILSIMASQVSSKIIATMGTNGKTTTNALMSHILSDSGYKVIINRTGANMLNGIVSAFVLSTNDKCLIDADYACLEVDEIAGATVIPMLQPHIILLTNITRDQLDRLGEVDAVYKKIISACQSSPDSLLVINCDDILSYSLAVESGNAYLTYGIDEEIFDYVSRLEGEENIFCQHCNARVYYEFFHYGHLGMYACSGCDIKRPRPNFTASDVYLKNETYSFAIKCIYETGSDESSIDNTVYTYFPVNTLARTTYNIYNTLSAVAAISALEAHLPNIKTSIETFDFGNNREDIFQVGNTRVQLHLAKNPIGFQQKVSLILKDEYPKDIIILINDTYQDGEDVSWLWDVDFQHLARANASSLITAGTRRYDVNLRRKYEDIESVSTDDVKETILNLVENGTNNIYMIINYSSLYSLNSFLKKLSEESQGQ